TKVKVSPFSLLIWKCSNFKKSCVFSAPLPGGTAWPVVCAVHDLSRNFDRFAAAAQQILAAHHQHFGCTVGKVREIPTMVAEHGRGEKGGRRAMATTAFPLDPEIPVLASNAFDKSWQFVRPDPELAHTDMNEMRSILSRHIPRLAEGGERDLWRLANTA